MMLDVMFICSEHCHVLCSLEPQLLHLVGGGERGSKSKERGGREGSKSKERGGREGSKSKVSKFVVEINEVSTNEVLRE